MDDKDIFGNFFWYYVIGFENVWIKWLRKNLIVGNLLMMNYVLERVINFEFGLI